MAQDVYEAIRRNPKYQELVRKRSTLARLLSVVMFIIYFGFILLIAYAPKFLGTPLGAGVTTLGILLGLLVIVSAFALTGIYVRKANAEYDEMIRQLVEESTQ